MSNNSEALLQAILSLIARQTFPLDRLLEIVQPTGASAKQVKAFNLCDGSKGRTEIAKTLKLHQGSFIRSIERREGYADHNRQCRLIFQNTQDQERRQPPCCRLGSSVQKGD